MTNINTTNEDGETIGTYDFVTAHLRNPLKGMCKGIDWKECADAWLVTINGIAFEYYTGIGYRKKVEVYGEYRGMKWDRLPFDKQIAFSRAKAPTFDDVLYCLLSDCDAANNTFDDWCSDLGYDTDSRKALQTYLECQETATKLRKAKVNIEAEQIRLQDY